MIATRAGKFALELWAERHPDTTYVPDPDQLRLALDDTAEPPNNPPAQSTTGHTQ